MYDELMTLLHHGKTCYVTLTKIDGTVRKMVCVLGDLGMDCGNFARVFDVETNAYRTIRRDALLSLGT